jgi:omega-hydroxy-beta-dihydromenaquinone-9 sulfotransferase
MARFATPPSAATAQLMPSDQPVAEAAAGASATESAGAAAKGAKKERTWMPRMWIGMRLGTWLAFLIRNRFSVGWRFYSKTCSITTICGFNSILSFLEWLFFSRAVARTEVDKQPLFILGHWRSGTTWLHELLAHDPQFTSPSTHQASLPTACIVTRWWLPKFFFFLVPERRPMDNMVMGWDRPQEDEFALCNIGVPSPYLTMAFPNNGQVYEEYLTLDVSEPERARWKEALMTFLKKVTYITKKERMIVKSPPHTARVRTLLEMFPEARFVYIVRDPYVLYASTVHLWRTLYATQGMQTPNYQGIEEHVLKTFVRMYDRFEEDRKLIPPGRLYEMKYEDLVKNPVGQMGAIYEQLQLGDFGEVRPAIEAYLGETRTYKTNKYQLSDEDRRTVAKRWRKYAEHYGYPVS